MGGRISREHGLDRLTVRDDDPAARNRPDGRGYDLPSRRIDQYALTGTEYNPNNDITGTVYIAYQEGDSSGLDELDQPFIIEEIRDSEGNNQDYASFEQSNQQTYNTELEEVQKELDQVTELRQRLEDERDAVATNDDGAGAGGAGAGFFGDGGPSVGAIAAVLGVGGIAYALFGQEGS